MRRSYDDVLASLDGLLAFPVTPFSEEDLVDSGLLASHIDIMLSYGAQALFPGCGTGEMSALSADDFRAVVTASVGQAAGRVPVLPGVGFGAGIAIEMTQVAEAAGADGVLVFPPYLSSPGSGQYLGYYQAVAASTSLPVVVYQRDAAVFSPDDVRALADISNVIGLKDGTGRIDLLQQQMAAVDPSTFAFLNGVPTAELLAPSLRRFGITGYSSAILNFVPEIAAQFFIALRAGDDAEVERLTREAVLPFVRLRDRVPGYAVSLVKAGVRLRGMSAGPVRPPLRDPSEADTADLAALLEGLGVTAALSARQEAAVAALP